MKKAILTLALIMSIGATQVSLASSAPKHRYHPTTQQVDKQASPADEAIAAYSDTTATDTSDYADVDDNDNRAYHSKYSLGNYDDPFDFIGSVFGGGALSVVVHVENVVNLLARHHQGVGFLHGVDVEESVELVVLGAFVTGYLSCGYLTENRRHIFPSSFFICWFFQSYLLAMLIIQRCLSRRCALLWCRAES